MSTREDVKQFSALPIDFSAIELEPCPEAEPYFCTPEGAEIIGWLNGIHFILLPGDEAVYCVEPEMGEENTFVLPVGKDFREFLSYLLYCKCTSPLAQIAWMEEGQFRRLLAENARRVWPGCEETFQRRDQALSMLTETFGIQPLDPYARIRALQSVFDPAVLTFSDEYYDVLGLENPRHPGETEHLCGGECASAQMLFPEDSECDEMLPRDQSF